MQKHPFADAFQNIGFMQRNIKIQRVLGWSIKKYGSFLKYVVPVSKTATTHYIFQKEKRASTVLADNKIVNKYL